MKSTEKTICAVILTRNRPERCRKTVLQVAAAMAGMDAAVLVINNDGSKVDLPASVEGVRVDMIENPTNLGTAARNQALGYGRLLLMLDDDAVISPTSLRKAVDLMSGDPSIGALTFRISGTQGNEEACLLPTVFHGCACCFRAEALAASGGYPEWHSYYGEEYHVAFNLYLAGFRICMLTATNNVIHLRHATGRNAARIIRLNLLHNVSLWASRFPWKYLWPAISDTIRRYWLVARKEKAMAGFYVALSLVPLSILEGFWHRSPMSVAQFRRILLLDRIAKLSMIASEKGVRSVALAGTGKFPSLYAKEIQKHGLDISYILDTNPCWEGASIDNIPVLATSSGQIPAASESGAREHFALITGTGSIPESLFWIKAARATGMQAMHRNHWEENAHLGTIDLLSSQPTALLGFS